MKIIMKILPVILILFVGCVLRKQKEADEIINYYGNGKGVMERFTFGRDSLKEGLAIKYRINGTLERMENFHRGLLSGNQFEYYPDGTLKSREERDSGILNGLRILYYPSGLIASVGMFHNGNRILSHYEYYAGGANKAYYFFDFEGNLRFQSFYDERSGKQTSGEGEFRSYYQYMPDTTNDMHYMLGEKLRVLIATPIPPHLRVEATVYRSNKEFIREKPVKVILSKFTPGEFLMELDKLGDFSWTMVWNVLNVENGKSFEPWEQTTVTVDPEK